MKSTPQKLSVSCGSADLRFVVGGFDEVVDSLLKSQSKIGQVVLPCTLHDLARVSSDRQIANAYQNIDVMTTDGMPLVWWFRARLENNVERVYGPDILASVLVKKPNAKFIILCPNQTVLDELRKKFEDKIQQRSVQLVVVGNSAEPAERKRLATLVKSFGPDFVWIGVGSPNQVLLGTYLRDTVRLSITYWCVGAAIPFLAGTVRQAPRWMQQNGLEWLFRLMNEPHRLWRRYLVITPLFLFRLLFARIRNVRV